MCYTGKCPYESNMGDCTLVMSLGLDDLPEDAACVIFDKMLDEKEKKDMNRENTLQWLEGIEEQMNFSAPETPVNLTLTLARVRILTDAMRELLGKKSRTLKEALESQETVETIDIANSPDAMKELHNLQSLQYQASKTT